jgi:hypothetical protein
VNEDCPYTEVCIERACHPPCNVRNPCAEHAVCVNINHGSDCKCQDGFHGNGYVGCQPGIVSNSQFQCSHVNSHLHTSFPIIQKNKTFNELKKVHDHGQVCQYNVDCPPDKYCDRLNRVCINPCNEDSCGDNALCIGENHAPKCVCPPGYRGNAYISCDQDVGCKTDRECPDYLACRNRQCVSPCNCGHNAECIVKNHKSTCKCPPGYSGDPSKSCEAPTNPCDPNPCGVKALCELDRGNPICYCPKGMTGNPFQQCIPEGGECLKNTCGPNSGCRIINSKPSCFCLPNFEGNPPKKPCGPPANPCDPSPCGPNTQCALVNGIAKCSCLAGFIESPNTIRGCVEPLDPCNPSPCGNGAVCDSNRNPICYCPGSMNGNPFKQCVETSIVQDLCKPGPCGRNAECYVVENREQCYCRQGYYGDPYTSCREPERSVCNPNPCGPNAECLISPDGRSMCACPDNMEGDPTSIQGCQKVECVINSDCPDSEACIGNRCQDPCPGSCGRNTHCRVEKHHPVCFCNTGTTGNPYHICYPVESQNRPKNPCNPSPCGANENCRVVRNKAQCSCQKGLIGSPKTGCRPECILNEECPAAKTCINKKCIDVCIKGVCGINANCKPIDHRAVCQCNKGYIGDAFTQCVKPPERDERIDPCNPSPCDPGVTCIAYDGRTAICDVCSSPHAKFNPKCRPECISNSECPFNRACINQKCIDPCPGSCGFKTKCEVRNHEPVCDCVNGYVGNPFEQCVPRTNDETPTTCDNIACGPNTECGQRNSVFKCVCKKGFYGDPLIGCRPECVINSDCTLGKACINYKCADPCNGACGQNAKCEVINHTPMCTCPPGTEGNPFIACEQRRDIGPIVPLNPCDPSPCGPNSRCLISQDRAICSCLPGYRGLPPSCRPDCVISTDCALDRACANQKCVDPCPGTCGQNANCQVINHNPICSCPTGQVGDPFISCQYAPDEPIYPEDRNENPCQPSPCGANSVCQVRENRPVCSCLENFIGKPPHCRPECVLNSECPLNKACIREKCIDPCKNACGQNADCKVVSHSAQCSCKKGYEGDSFVGCSRVIEDPKNVDPCNPSPCAPNAECSVYQNAAKCSCIPPYKGDPYQTGCRPECILSTDCPSSLACVNNHCRDPCPGVCGPNAECSVANHIPHCSCSKGFNGDPFGGCRKISPIYVPPESKNPCEPSPCGPNSLCRVVDGRPACSCLAGYLGVPPSCRPECVVNSECDLNEACISQKCKDPCIGTCGRNAHCQVINHSPICSCPLNYIGDPFVQCSLRRESSFIPEIFTLNSNIFCMNS